MQIMNAAKMRRSSLAGLILCASVGCAGAPDDQPAVTITDSAGITIVTNQRPDWASGEGWRLSELPVFDLGSYDAEGPESFERVVGTRRLSSGVIVVAEGGARELRFFDEDGGHIRTVGRQGGGPGEFESLRFLRLWRGDSLVVHDGRRRTVSLFDSAGQFGRSFRLEPADSVRFPYPVGLLADGELVARGFERRDGPPAPGVTRQVVPLHRFDLAGAFVGHGPRLAGDEIFVMMMGNDLDAGISAANMRFGHGTRLGVGPADVVVMPSHRGELTWYSGGGHTIRRIARWPAENQPVKDADWERNLEERTSSPRMPENIKQAFREMPRANTMPLAEGIVVDDGGNVWLRDFRGPLDTTSSLTVLTADGELLGRVAVPFRFRPDHIGEDFVLGTWEDEDDIPHVQMYRLIK